VEVAHGETFFAFELMRALSLLAPNVHAQAITVSVRQEVLDAAHWVGAITRGAEGSYMQLQEQLCGWIKAAI
jgi:hypothetical protein